MTAKFLSIWVLSAFLVTSSPAILLAQDDDRQQRQAQQSDDDDDEGDRGLWGLLGLVGLAGLAGLRPRQDHLRPTDVRNPRV